MERNYIETEYEIIDTLKDDGERPRPSEYNVALAYDKRGKYFCVIKRRDARSAELYKCLKEMKNPHIPEIYRVIERDGQLIIIEEYIHGQTLKELIEYSKSGRVDENLAADIIRQLCECLEPLHRADIIHRDIKLSNIMLTKSGAVKLIDFGIARTVKRDAEADTEFLGTRGYAPPEQYGLGQTDARSDIYQIGVTMHRLLGDDYDGRLQKVILRCTAHAPAYRYPSVRELTRDLDGNGRPRRALYIAAAALSVVIAAIILSLNLSKDAPDSGKLPEESTVTQNEPPANFPGRPANSAVSIGEKSDVSKGGSEEPRPGSENATAGNEPEKLLQRAENIQNFENQSRFSTAVNSGTDAKIPETASQIPAPVKNPETGSQIGIDDKSWLKDVRFMLYLNDRLIIDGRDGTSDNITIKNEMWQKLRRADGEAYLPEGWNIRLRVENKSDRDVMNPRLRVIHYGKDYYMNGAPLYAGGTVDFYIPLDKTPLSDMIQMEFNLFLTKDTGQYNDKFLGFGFSRES